MDSVDAVYADEGATSAASHPPGSVKQPREQRVLSAVGLLREATACEIAGAAGMAPEETKAILDRLEGDGQVELVDGVGGTRYRSLTAQAAPEGPSTGVLT
ncbi:MAG TPA: hypothetical protein VFE78_11960 [Gemmataceae bacterium]|nr:hypothetical protein [Gemmataceae bacterium]